MIKKLGGEYELKDAEIKTSSLEARKIFFKLIWEMKPDVVIDLLKPFNFEAISSDQDEPSKIFTKLFLLHTKHHYYYAIDLTKLGLSPNVRDTPLFSYFDFIFRNQTEFDGLKRKHEERWQNLTSEQTSSLAVNSALKEFIPDWKTLQLKNNSERLCEILTKWSEKWNLKEEWCLDFALACLRKTKIDCIDRILIPENYLETNDNSPSLKQFTQYWQKGKAWEQVLYDDEISGHSNSENYLQSPKFDYFSYDWKQDVANETKEIFSVNGLYNPFTTTSESFRKYIEEQFLRNFFTYCQRYSSDNLKALIQKLENFDNSLEAYISRNESKAKKIANKTIYKRDGDKHFRWLIDFQIPSEKTYKKIAEENQVEGKTLREGIQSVSEILLLNLRKSMKSGRPKGTTEYKKRRNYQYW